MKSKYLPALAGILLVLVALFYAFSSQSNEQIVVTHGVITPAEKKKMESLKTQLGIL